MQKKKRNAAGRSSIRPSLLLLLLACSLVLRLVPVVVLLLVHQTQPILVQLSGGPHSWVATLRFLNRLGALVAAGL